MLTAPHPGVQLKANLKSISHTCTSSRWHMYGSGLKKPWNCPWVVSRVAAAGAFLQAEKAPTTAGEEEEEEVTKF